MHNTQTKMKKKIYNIFIIVFIFPKSIL